MIEGWYYLHTNNELIYKRDLDGAAADIRESDFAVGLWPMDPSDRAGAWRICVESLAAGARPERVKELASKWGCDDADALTYAKHVGVTLDNGGSPTWCAMRKDFVNLRESKAGFGPTCLEALADLAKALGYRPSKMWGATFEDLLKVEVKHGK
jgi:hypothetical protein